jgi:hypothetical protein
MLGDLISERGFFEISSWACIAKKVKLKLKV